jgi:hypothetical protein
MERQILVQNEMRQRAMATQIAFSREMFMWWGSFYAVACTGAVLGQVNLNYRIVLPLVIFIFTVA